MKDIEASVTVPTIDMSTLRQRKNATTPSSSNSADLKRHQNLVRQINRASEDDDEDKAIKEAIMLHQKETNKQMTKTLMNCFLFLVGFVIFLYVYLSYGDNDASNKSSLAKALGILLGLNKRAKISLPPNAKVFATTSIMKSDLDQFIYPSWPWSSSKNDASQFLVPKSGKGSEIQNILHRTALLKKDRGITIDLYDPSEMLLFLQGEHGLKCNSAIDGNNKSIFDQYLSLGKSGAKEAQKMLWVWCAFYSGEAYGFLDLDAYEVHLGPSLIHGLANSRIKNFALDSTAVEVADGSAIDPTFVTSVIFISETMSSVAEGMITYIVNADADGISNDFMSKSIDHLNGLIESEIGSWTLARTNCAEPKNTFTLADICSPAGCCEVDRPRTR